MTREIRELRTDEFKGMHIAKVLNKLHEYGLVPQAFTYEPNTIIKLEDYDMEDQLVRYYIDFDRWECQWCELMD